jgi:2-polyprenyl-6-hydroxyphenyl methylase/3-demethylubiquinone-9 3-methyltransferase
MAKAIRIGDRGAAEFLDDARQREFLSRDRRRPSGSIDHGRFISTLRRPKQADHPRFAQKIAMNPTTAADPRELAKFEATAADWWDPTGPLAPLHRMNPVRIAFIRDAAVAGRQAPPGKPLRGLTVLDVGCGGGLLAEPLTRLGARVTGIDLVADALEVARRHAERQGLAIDYRLESVEAAAARGARFDVVVASEVIEHVPDQQGFVHHLATLTAADGVICVSTLNRTARAYLEAILAAEGLLGWLPRGTHDWKRFVKPSELAAWLRAAGFRVDRLAGIGWKGWQNRFELRRDVAVNYLASARRG